MKERSAIEVEVKEGRPPDLRAWDDLARDNGNLVQSSLFDPTQVFFSMKPVYFAALDEGRLCGGVKLYESANHRLPPITERLTLGFTQLGETLLSVGFGPARDVIRQSLDGAVSRYLRSVGAVSLRVLGLYGGEDSLVTVTVPPSAAWPFNVAWIDLSLTGDNLWTRMHKSHRAEVRKAERNGLKFSREGSIKRFVSLVDETYRGQEMSGPDRGYVQHFYEALSGSADLFFAAQGSEYLAGALCLCWGDVAYWHFGGTARQGRGAGAYLQWQVMKYYKDRGIRRYVLGQVAAEDDPSNPKFTVGITRFKRHFGPDETPSASRLYVLRPRHHVVWKTLSTWATRFKRLTTWTTPR